MFPWKKPSIKRFGSYRLQADRRGLRKYKFKKHSHFNKYFYTKVTLPKISL